MENKKPLYHITKLLVELMLYSGIVLCIAIPIYINRFTFLNPVLSLVLGKTIAVLLVSGIAAIYILWELRLIFITLTDSNANPFIIENVKSLRKMAIASFIIALTYVVKCLFWFTLATIIIIIVFAIAGLFCLVLADVFQQAITYKEENDLTV